MVKRALAGKSGKYGRTDLKKDPVKKKAAGKTRKSSKKTIPQSGKKALVPKEVLEALKENRKEKQDKRKEALEEKKKNPKKRKSSEPKEPKEPLKKKALKKVRKACEDNEYENLTKIKALWEKGRVNDIADSKRAEIVAELKELMEGKVESLMFKHDLARVVQLLLRLGKSEDNNFIVQELLPHVCELSKAKYGKFTVNCMLKNTSPKQRKLIFKALKGQFKKLTLHAEAVTVIDTMYNDYATSKERTEMITEFYGKELYLYRDLLSEHFTKVIELYPDKKEKVLEELLNHTQVFIEKGLTGHIIVQHLMLQYFLHGTEETIQELVSEKLIEQIVKFVHTKEGSKIAMRCLWYSKAKERKLIIRTFKGHVKDMCMNENGYLVLCALFDCVDDTVLLKKAILSEIMESIDTITMSHCGRLLLNYILAPRSTKLFPPSIIDFLKIGDTNSVSKKDPEARRKELLTYASPGIIDNFKDNVESMLMENTRTLLLTSAVTHANCDITDLLTAIVDLLASDLSLVDTTTMHILMRSVQQNKDHQKQFNDIVTSKIPLDDITNWAKTNRGAFSVLRLIEQKTTDKHDELVSSLKQSDVSSFEQCAGRDKLLEFLNTC